MIKNLTDLQFVLLIVAFISGVMIILQGAIRRTVWNWYLIAFFGSVVGYAVTLR